MNKLQKQIAGAVITAGATLGVSEAFANTTCGCSQTGNYVGRIDKSDTFDEAFKDAPAAAIAKKVKPGTECHIRGHGRKDGENYTATYLGNGQFTKWERFKGGNKCEGTGRVVTGGETPIRATNGKTTGSFTETSKGEVKTSTKYVVDLNELPKACRAEVIDHGRKLKP